MKLAKVGDTFTKRAAARLAKMSRLGEMISRQSVQPKSPGERGSWVCVDCGEVPQNNFMADGHTKSHRMAWWNSDASQVETVE